MANIKKFENPVSVGFRVEKTVKEEIQLVAGNKNDWLNEAVSEKLKKRSPREIANIMFRTGFFHMYAQGNFDIDFDTMVNVLEIAISGGTKEDIEALYESEKFGECK